MMYQAGSDARFEACLPFTLKEEGGYSNDKHDSGGMTMEGIIQREYDRWRTKNSLPTQWVHKISDGEVSTIYHDEYWMPHCPQLPAGVDVCFFDLAVNGGPHEAVVILQRALEIADDGAWGPQTSAHVEAITDALTRSLVVNRYCDRRAAFYRSLRTFRYFGGDWLRRTENIRAAALKMARAI